MEFESIEAFEQWLETEQDLAFASGQTICKKPNQFHYDSDELFCEEC